MGIIKQVMIDGSKVENGQTIQVDHYEQTFIVKIRSLSGVGEDGLKDTIQKRFEVTEIRESEITAFCRN